MVRLTLCQVALTALILTVFPHGLAVGQESTEGHQTGSFLDRLQYEGYVQSYVSFPRRSDGEESSFKLAEEGHIGLRMEPLDWLGSEFGWLHEHEYEEEEGQHELGIFTAAVVAGPHEGAWWVKGGIQFLPFTMFDLAGVHAVHGRSIGPFDTGAIVDPVSYEFGAIREKSVIFGTALGSFAGNVYGYYGDDKRINDSRFGYGGTVGYRQYINDGNEFYFNLSFINDLGNVEIYQDEVFGRDEPSAVAGLGPSSSNDEDRVPGWSVATNLVLGNVSMTGEYLFAQGRFASNVLEYDGRGARPSAWSIEARYGFEWHGRNGDFLLGYQGSSEATGLALSASRYVAVLNFDLWSEILYGTFEWFRDEDYGVAHSGTGTNKSRYTFMVGLAF